jgi:transcriptional regulator with XRE-family HTH domain
MSVLADLQRLMARNSYSQKQVADQTKLSTTTISQYLNGTYPGNIEKVEAAITNLISREDEKSRNRKVRAEFVKTRLASKCLARMGVTADSVLKMAAQNKLSLEDVSNALKGQAEVIDEKYAKTQTTISSA